jgi:hypothetical protein
MTNSCRQDKSIFITIVVVFLERFTSNSMTFTRPFTQVNQAATITTKRTMGVIIVPEHFFFAARAG